MRGGTISTAGAERALVHSETFWTADPPGGSDALDRLVEAARKHKMSPAERFEQRVSFIFGQTRGQITKDRIRQILRGD